MTTTSAGNRWRLLLFKIKRRFIIWLGQELVGMEALKAASYTGAVGVLRDLLNVAENEIERGGTLQQFTDMIALNYYSGRGLLMNIEQLFSERMAREDSHDQH